MINELAQWLVLAALVFLLLGVLRQMGLMLPPDERAPSASGGPELGKRAPSVLLEALKDLSNRDRNLRENGSRTIAFVTERCTGCSALLASLAQKEKPVQEPIVLVARRPSSAFRQAIEQTGLPVIFDVDGDIWQTCQVFATPLVVRLDSTGRVVAKEVTHRVEGFETG
jgi:hypothetical protein